MPFIAEGQTTPVSKPGSIAVAPAKIGVGGPCFCTQGQREVNLWAFASATHRVAAASIALATFTRSTLKQMSWFENLSFSTFHMAIGCPGQKTLREIIRCDMQFPESPLRRKGCVNGARIVHRSGECSTLFSCFMVGPKVDLVHKHMYIIYKYI